MHTEKEAKKRWCPRTFRPVKVYGEDGKWTESTDGPGGIDDTRCIGSACMAWRFGGYDGTDASSPAVGYCGLAGKP